MIFFIVGLATFLLSLFFVWLVGIFAYRFGWVAMPRDDRWNKRTVALYGGVAIFSSFCLGLFFLLLAERTYYFPTPLFLIFLGSIIMFLVGLADDRLKLKPSTKLIGQIIAASIPIIANLTLTVTPWHIVNIVITFLWFIGIVNAINLVDNMDGLAAGVVAISIITLIMLRVLTPLEATHDWIFGMEVVFLYAVAGFWAINRYPAAIFMGDSGSLFLGYMLAGLAMLSTQGNAISASSTLFSFLLPATVLAIPIFDTVLVTIARKSRGRAVSMGGRDHSSHRLVGLGFSEEKSVYILYGLSVLGGIMAVAIKIWAAYSIPFLALYLILLLFIGIYLGRVKVYSVPETSEFNHKWTPLLTEVFYKRHVGEVILDFVLIALSYFFAYYLRFEGSLKDQFVLYVQSLPIVLVANIFGLYLVGAYRGIWHFISLTDVIRYGKGVIVGISVSVFLLAVFYRFGGYSRAVFVIFGVFLFLFIVGSRLSFRIFDDIIKKRTFLNQEQERGIIIYGAGKAGRMIYEECLQNSDYANCRIIGFIDDDPQKQHFSIAGLEILAPEELTTSHYKKKILPRELWVSSGKISSERVVKIVQEIECLTGSKIGVRKFSMKIEELKES